MLVLHAIPGVEDLEACVLQGLGADRGVHEVGQAVAHLDVALDAAVVLVLRVVLVGEAPLVASEDGAGLQHAQDLPVDFGAVGRVAGGLDGVHRVERGVGEGQLHEVRLDELHLAADALLHGDGVAAVHLELVDGHCLDLGAGEACDVPRRAADAAAAVQHGGAFADAEAAGEVVLVAEDGLLETLALAPVREVEARAPAPLVELRRQVVVGVDEVGVILVPVLGGLCVVVLVVVPIDLAVLLRLVQRAEENQGLLQAGPQDRAGAQEEDEAERTSREGERARRHDEHRRQSHEEARRELHARAGHLLNRTGCARVSAPKQPTRCAASRDVARLRTKMA
mmetsp:Transcript_120850/g.347154  ORF Transcript_120850/g.347154 Transcript_120850/m.347154 type:complete len:339 (+) Transcript_120850:370-1386(+)